MSAPSPLALLNPLTLDQLRTLLIGFLRAAADPVTDWNDGAERLTQMQYSALGINELTANLAPAMAGDGYFAYAQQDITNGDDWADIIAEQTFETTRTPAVLTQQMLHLSSDGTKGPFTIGPSFVVVSPLTGNRYYAITFGTLTTGAPNSIDIIVQAEAPNDPTTGAFYADGPNSLTEIATPLPGVTATNAAPDFSAVTTTPSPALGLGVVTLSGTPMTVPTAFDFQIVSDGQNTTGRFRYRRNGGAWSASTVLAATYAIPATGITVHFTNDAGGSNPSFRAGDVYSFSSPGSPISRPGVAQETTVALVQRCYDRWIDYTAIGEDKRAVWAKAAEGTVKRVAVAVDTTYPGRWLVTIAGAPGTSPLSGGVVATAQGALDAHDDVGDLSLVAAASNATITATNDTGGQVTVPASKLTSIQAAAELAWAAYVDSTDVGGIVRVAQLEKILMDAGAIDVTGLLLNGGGNVILGTHEVAIAADVTTSLTWVGV